MGLTIDNFLEKIGSFSRFQYKLLFFCGFMELFGAGLQIMIPTFLSAEPPWRCKANSSACNLTGIFKPGDEKYNYRCSIPRGDWEFDTTEFNSVVSEVRLKVERSWKLPENISATFHHLENSVIRCSFVPTESPLSFLS